MGLPSMSGSGIDGSEGWLPEPVDDGSDDADAHVAWVDMW